MEENERKIPKITFKNKHKFLNDGFKIMSLLVKIRIDLNRKQQDLNNEQRYQLKKEAKILKQLDKIEAAMKDNLISAEKIIKFLEDNKETPHLIKIKKIG